MAEGECGPGAFGPIGAVVFLHSVPGVAVLALDVPLSLTLDMMMLPFTAVHEALGSRPSKHESVGPAPEPEAPVDSD